MENIVETSTVNVIVTSTSNHVMEFHQNYLDQKHVQPYTLPSNPARGQLQQIPKGWIRKIIPTVSGHDKVFYYNPSGKKFSTRVEVDQYFGRLGQTVFPGLFNFEPPKSADEDEEMEDDELSSESESLGRANCSSTPSTAVTMQQQQQLHTLFT